MIYQVILPKLGQTMDEGAIIEWQKSEGEPVQRGDVLFTVESDKAVLEVESTARGFLRKVLVPAGQVVPVLTVVALISRKADEDLGDHLGAAETETGAHPLAEAVDAPEIPATSSLSARERPQGRIFASPRARKTAREQGVDLAAVRGTGPNGRIVEKDVLAFAAAKPKATPAAAKAAEGLGVDLAQVAGTGVSGRIMRADVEAVAAPPTPAPTLTEPAQVQSLPMSGTRRIIAERMAASDLATARVTLVTEADATDLVRTREQLKAAVTEDWGFAPGYNDLLGLIVSRALGELRYMNARLSDEGSAIEHLPAVNLGMAVDTERGLLVPVIRDADQLGLRAFGTEFRALVERARTGKSLPDDLAGGSFTITNLGMYDVDAFTPIINLPEAAILGVGRIQPKAVIHEGEVVARQMWTLSLAFDHRLVDGAPAARFLQRIKELIESPFLLLS